jgi:hypothetical protein
MAAEKLPSRSHRHFDNQLAANAQGIADFFFLRILGNIQSFASILASFFLLTRTTVCLDFELLTAFLDVR